MDNEVKYSKYYSIIFAFDVRSAYVIIIIISSA